ncbi:hypothetical protein ONA23_01730 [Mycoplasmopsis cynos]|uniref:hypothetical protein n=1 Tax=Mycoplasmopsis cynos TaxID=171284 RepID=UPI0024CA05C6|nr:hypothetical protein [Mycoplasmopsis cynos]WAM06917.1 hypothetical protein ONA23_01730 [Mycoplasmopsis cynos]
MLCGEDENGKNCYVLSYNEDIYIVNTGVKVPINAHNGVDTLIPDFTYLESNKDKIKGILISDIRNESFSVFLIIDENTWTKNFYFKIK